MSERVDIVTWLRDLRHSPAVREIGDVGRGLHLAEAEITRLRAEVERLRNGAAASREMVQPAATTVDAAAVDAAPSPNSVAAQTTTCDVARQPFDSASTTDHDAAPAATAEVAPGTGHTPTLTDDEFNLLEWAKVAAEWEADEAAYLTQEEMWRHRAAVAAALLARLGGE